MKTIYLAHALSNASKPFQKRMITLRDSLNTIPNVKVLQFAWVDGVGPKPNTNVYQHDMACVSEANLLVAVLDEFSFGVGMEIQKRSELGRPIVIFHPEQMKVPKIISDCIVYNDSKNNYPVTGLIIPYRTDGDIVKFVSGAMKS